MLRFECPLLWPRRYRRVMLVKIWRDIPKPMNRSQIEIDSALDEMSFVQGKKNQVRECEHLKPTWFPYEEINLKIWRPIAVWFPYLLQAINEKLSNSNSKAAPLSLQLTSATWPSIPTTLPLISTIFNLRLRVLRCPNDSATRFTTCRMKLHFGQLANFKPTCKPKPIGSMTSVWKRRMMIWSSGKCLVY